MKVKEAIIRLDKIKFVLINLIVIFLVYLKKKKKKGKPFNCDYINGFMSPLNE